VIYRFKQLFSRFNLLQIKTFQRKMDASSNFTVTGATGPEQPEGYHQGHSQGQHPTHLGGVLSVNPSSTATSSTGVAGGASGVSSTGMMRQPSEGFDPSTAGGAGGGASRSSTGQPTADEGFRQEVDELLRVAEGSLREMDDQIRNFSAMASGVAGRLMDQNDQRKVAELRQQMEAKRARIQKELEDLLSGGTNTNLMFAEAARTLASALASTASVSTAARGATAGGAGTSTGPASSTPLVDLDGREYTGFLDKKKAAENLEFSTAFRRLASELMIDQAMSGHNFKIDVDEFKRRLERPRQNFTGVMKGSLESGMPSSTVLDRLKGIPAYESNPTLRRFLVGRVFQLKYFCKESAPPTDIHSLLIGLENWELLGMAVLGCPEYKGLFDPFRKLVEDARYRFLPIGFWKPWIEQCMLDAQLDIGRKYSTEMRGTCNEAPAEMRTVEADGTSKYHALEYLKARVAELGPVLEEPRFVEHFNSMKAGMLEGHRTMEAKFLREDQDRYGTADAEGAGSKKEKDRKTEADPFKTPKKRQDVNGDSNGRGGGRRADQDSGGGRSSKKNSAPRNRSGSRERTRRRDEKKPSSRNRAREDSRGRESKREREQSPGSRRRGERHSRSRSRSRGRSDDEASQRRGPDRERSDAKPLCRQNIVFLATGRDSDKCAARKCLFAHVGARSQISEQKWKDFLAKARLTDEERTTILGAFGNSGATGSTAGGAAAGPSRSGP